MEQVRGLHKSLQSQILRLISEFELATSIKVEGIVVHHVTQVGFVQQVQGVTVTAQL